MKTITIKLYEFGELSDEVRKAIAEKKCFDMMNDVMECHNSEYEASLKAFKDATGFGARNWEVGYCEHHFRRDNPEWAEMGSDDNPLYAEDIKGRLLWRWCYRFVESNRSGKYHGKLVPCEKSAEHPNAVRHVKRYSRATMEPITGGWCPWTGVVTDCALVEPIVDFYLNYYRGKYSEDYTLEDLIDDCLNAMDVMGAQVAFLPLGGSGDEWKQAGEARQEMVRRLHEVGEMALSRGKTIAIRTQQDARADLVLLKAVDSEGVKIYFNLQDAVDQGRCVCKELKWLGRENIAQIHASLTDSVTLDKDPRIDLRKVKRTLDKMKWRGWLVVERSRNAQDVRNVKGNFGTNVAYLKEIFQSE